jgi:hypothetical protein
MNPQCNSRWIDTVNKWTKYLPPEKYKPVKVKKIEMKDEDLDTASKLDRSPSFIKYMMDYGYEQAGIFLNKWSPKAQEGNTTFFQKDMKN